jgi:hypothetical protein
LPCEILQQQVCNSVYIFLIFNVKHEWKKAQKTGSKILKVNKQSGGIFWDYSNNKYEKRNIQGISSPILVKKWHFLLKKSSKIGYFLTKIFKKHLDPYRKIFNFSTHGGRPMAIV